MSRRRRRSRSRRSRRRRMSRKRRRRSRRRRRRRRPAVGRQPPKGEGRRPARMFWQIATGSRPLRCSTDSPKPFTLDKSLWMTKASICSSWELSKVSSAENVVTDEWLNCSPGLSIVKRILDEKIEKNLYSPIVSSSWFFCVCKKILFTNWWQTYDMQVLLLLSLADEADKDSIGDLDLNVAIAISQSLQCL